MTIKAEVQEIWDEYIVAIVIAVVVLLFLTILPASLSLFNGNNSGRGVNGAESYASRWEWIDWLASFGPIDWLVSFGSASLTTVIMFAFVYREISLKMFEIIVGGPTSEDSKDYGSPKALFDHFRNYFIAGIVLVVGLVTFKQSDLIVSMILASMIFMIAIILFLINLIHGIYATHNFIIFLSDSDKSIRDKIGKNRKKILHSWILDSVIGFFMLIFLIIGLVQSYDVFLSSNLLP